MSPTRTLPVEFRVGDRVRLRKVHPCGGWTWLIIRLGADIGLICETCGRKILLDRITLERRVKSFLERGLETEAASLPAADQRAEEPTPALDLRAGDELAASANIPVRAVCYYATGTDFASGKLRQGQIVRVVQAPDAGEPDVLVEPADSDAFEREFIPGGIRTQDSYEGFALMIPWRELAQQFRPVSAAEIINSTSEVPL